MRGALKFALGEAVDLTTTVLYQDQKGDGLATFNTSLGYPKFDNTLDEGYRDKFWLPSATLTVELGRVQLKSISSYYKRTFHRDEDYTLFLPDLIPATGSERPILNTADQKQKVVTQELRGEFENDDKTIGAIAGFFYYKSKLRSEQNILGSTVRLFNSDTLITEKQKALFGEVYWKPWAPLTLTVGLRKTFSEVVFDRISSGQLAGSPPPPRVIGSRKDNPLTPKYNLAFALDDQTNIYAQAAKGFRVGSAAAPIPSTCNGDLEDLGISAAPGFGPDQLWTYEGGVKHASGGSSIAVAAYRTEWKGKPEPVFLPSCGFTTTANSGTVRINGVEVEASVRPLTGLSLSGSLAYTDAEYTEDAIPSGFLKGEELPATPKWAASAAVEYRTDFGGRDGFVRLDYAYRDRSYVASPRLAQRQTLEGFTDSYHLVNGRAGTTLGSFELELFVNNVFNTHPKVSIVPLQGRAKTGDRATTLRPRTVGFAVSKRF